jgi:hypothetical protein
MQKRVIMSAQLASVLAVTGALAACGRSIDNPRAPDSLPLQTTYDLPQGHLSAESIVETARDFAERIQLKAATGDMGMVGNVLAEAEDSGLIDDRATLDQSEHPRRLLTIDITRVCRGTDPDTTSVDAERFGTMTMTLKASEHGLFPVVWGSFDRCIEAVNGQVLTLDGDYFVSIRASSTAGQVDLLYAFSGLLTNDTVDFTGNLDFRLLADGSSEVRVHAADGDVVVGVDGLGRETVRDVVGEWVCELSELHCMNTDTQQVVMP